MGDVVELDIERARVKVIRLELARRVRRLARMIERGEDPPVGSIAIALRTIALEVDELRHT